MIGGYMNKAYDIDLSTGQIKDLPISEEDRRLYLGGKGLATRLLYDQTSPGLDPYSEEMVIIFSTGPVTGTAAPQSNRFVVTTKSPLTGGIANSTCGGNFATKLKRAGVDLVLVRGKADKPVYVEITEEGAEIKDATHLWGKGTMEVQAELPKAFGKAVIGPAGENKVRYACVVSEERVAGRTGCGAVMGAKNLKGIIANGKQKVGVSDPEGYKGYKKQITKFLLDHPMTGGILPRLGTANIVMTASGRNILPVFNFSQGTHHRAPEISGEMMASKHLKKQVGCTSCPINCGRGIELKGKLTKGPEYETVGLFGSNIGNWDLKKIYEWNYLADDMGMDTISLGGVLGFATELTEKGLLESDLNWESHDDVGQLIEDIAHRRGLGDDLAEGVMRLSEKFGGKEFAIHVKGLELPAYDPRGCYGQGLEYATTNRGGCHVQGATMYLEAVGPLSIDPHSIKAKPELVALQQNIVAALCSSVYCVFSTYAMIPGVAFSLNPQGLIYKTVIQVLLNSGPILDIVLGMKPPLALKALTEHPLVTSLLGADPIAGLINKLKAPASVLWFERFLSYVIGRQITILEFAEIGERVFNMERLYNIREGFSSRDDTLPPRMLHESTFEGIRGGVPLDRMLPKYYKLRGWDQNGVPTDTTLKQLSIRR
jgi:aldehyde:ferredoxin oxidoreductase